MDTARVSVRRLEATAEKHGKTIVHGNSASLSPLSRGVFRVHQFEKVEQFVLCKPEESWEIFDQLIANSEEFYKALELPYRIVSIVSGALNNAAAKKYDLEAWFPNEAKFRELVSCSNCTDYQTRPLEIRYGYKQQKTTANQRKEYVHALNATLCATERTLCCLLENYQTQDGLRIPKVLRKYIPGQPDFIPFLSKGQNPTEVLVNGMKNLGVNEKEMLQ